MSFAMTDLTTADIIGIASIVTAIITAAVPPLRRLVQRFLARVVTYLGFPGRRYRRWFLDQYSHIYNLYLDQRERLGITETFVPLTLAVTSRNARPAVDVAAHSLVATDVMADQDASRVVVLGDAGAGKSTLLKAYAVSLLSRKRAWRLGQRRKEIPVLVPLRSLARDLRDHRTLEACLTDQLLAGEAGLGWLGASFLKMVIRQHRLLLLLDGIDEVSSANYGYVRAAIHEFAQGYGDRVRIVVTCRQQNFRTLRGDWIPSFSDRAYVLAEFGDEDIRNYVGRRAASFVAPHSATSFIADVFEAGLVDLHRVPLVLAMSVGLYASHPDFEIPPTVSLLYEAMIEDLLQRRENRLWPAGNSNTFALVDKQVFLSKFAFDTAEKAGRFDDFKRAEIAAAARQEAPSLANVPQSAVEAFVDEVVNRSGLIAPVTDEGDLTFAHRSVFEYLAANHLRGRKADGAEFLIANAKNPQWRQPILFYSAMSQDGVEQFLTDLADTNLDLAGYCLGVAPCGDQAGPGIIARLERAAHRDAGLMLPALLFAARSPNADTRTHATKAFRNVVVKLGQAGHTAGDFGGDEGGLTRILSSVAASGSAEIVSAAAPLLGDLIPDSEAMVPVFWRCLHTADIDGSAGMRYLLIRLLTMATESSLFAILQTQPRLTRPRLTMDSRRQAYPFRHGQDIESNLVTLVTLGDRQSPPVEVANTFYEAKRSGASFKSVEKSKRLTIAIPSAIFWLPLQIAIVAIAYGLAIAGAVIGLRETYSFGSLGEGLHAIAEAVGLGVFGYIVLVFPMLLVAVLVAIAVSVTGEESSPILVLGMLCAPVLSVVMAPIARRSLWIYFVSVPAATLLIGLAVGVLAAASMLAWNICKAYRPIYFPPLNPFLKIYDDPKSMHWVTAPALVRDR
jgi:hypothetical protein